ncbi:MAG: hypothetical protein ACI36Y_06730 [Coriobacteriales bacterium]
MKSSAKILATLVATAGLTGAFAAGALATEGDDIFINPQAIVISVEGTQYTLGVDEPLAVDVNGDGFVNNTDMDKVNIKVVSVDGATLTNVGTQSGLLDNQGRKVLEYNYVKVGPGAMQSASITMLATTPSPATSPMRSRASRPS